jgi:cyclopropane fatty-acyl-phospholipid synthase-like methyltransferase
MEQPSSASYDIGLHERQTEIRNVFDQKELQSIFEDQADKYKALLESRIQKRARALDLGCGWGNFSYFLKRIGFKEVDGIDFDRSQLDLAQKVVDANLIQADLFEYLENCGDSPKYDLIGAVDLLEHLKRGDVPRFITLCRKNLCQGGVLVLRTPAADSPFSMYSRYNDLAHEYCYSSNAIYQLLRIHRFTSVTFLEDFYAGRSVLRRIRALLGKLLRELLRFYLRAAGFRRPRILSENMWIIAS